MASCFLSRRSDFYCVQCVIVRPIIEREKEETEMNESWATAWDLRYVATGESIIHRGRPRLAGETIVCKLGIFVCN